MIRLPEEVIEDLITKYGSARAFARAISEDSSDVLRWCKGIRPVSPRAVVKICELHPEILPYELNPGVFPFSVDLVFNKEKKMT